MSQIGLNARRSAAAMMTAVTEDHNLLNAVLPDIVAGLEPAERARAGRLAAEALRWAQRSDRLLGPHLRNRPEDAVMNLLRLALYEIKVEGVPEHAAVNAAVALSPKPKAGLVNAVLRNVARLGTDWDALPVPTMPKWLRKRLIAAWGKEAVVAMEAVHVMPVPLDLTVREDPSGWAEKLGATVLTTGSLRLREASQVSAKPGFDEGAWWVQDAAAALPARLLDVHSGERVLDLCAAPGGKTMQLAATGAEVTALDMSSPRLERLRENLARTGLKAEIVVADALHWVPGQPFDAILLDAPCSATGTLRRHPDLVHAKDGSEIEGLCALQATFIDRALGWLKPGGRMVYCTCSLLPDEGEEQLAAALERHPGLVAAPCGADWIDPRWHAPGGGLRIRPDHWAAEGGIDGFFMTLVRKPA